MYSTTNRDHLSIDNKDTLTPAIEFLSETYKHFPFFRIFTIPPGVRKVILLYASLILFSVLIFKVFMKLSIIDSLYFVITTTTTVGYGDFNLMQAPVWLKIYGSVIMLAGAALLATLFSVITDNIISKRLGGYLNYSNRKIKNHVIVAGLGSIGLGVANCLSEMGIKTVAIEKNPDNSYMHALKGKLPLLIGDASDPRILFKAGIKRAQTLVALIDDDLNNVNIILKGNSLNNDLHTVARIFTHELNKKAKSAFQIDNVISASFIAVPYILCSLIHKNILWAGHLHNTVYAIYLIDLCKYDFLVDLNRIHLISEFSINPLLLKRNDSIIRITEQTIFLKDDLLYVFSDYKSLVSLFSR